MRFYEPNEDSILFASIDLRDPIFDFMPRDLVRWLCLLIEQTQEITVDVPGKKLEETLAALREKSLTYLPFPSSFRTQDNDLPLRQYVSLVGFGDLLPQDSAVLKEARSDLDWRKAFSGDGGKKLLGLLLESKQLTVLEQIEAAGAHEAAIALLRTLPLDQRLELYRRRPGGVPARWIPRVEQLPQLPESKAEYFIFAHSIGPCIADSVLSEQLPDSACIETMGRNEVALEVALLILADVRPDDRERLHLLDPTPDRLLDLIVRLSPFSGDAHSLIRELIESGHAIYHTEYTAKTESVEWAEEGDVRPTILGWLERLLDSMPDDQVADWLMNPNKGSVPNAALPYPVSEFLLDYLEHDSIWNAIRSTILSILVTTNDSTPAGIIDRNLLERTALWILDDPETEDLPVLCYIISQGVLQQELHSEAAYLRGIRAKAQVDPKFKEALPSLNVPTWPDKVDRDFWQQILKENGLGPEGSAEEVNPEEDEDEPDNTSLTHWLNEFPGHRDRAALRFLTPSPATQRTSPEDMEVLREILESEEWDAEIRICLLGELITIDRSKAEDFSDIGVALAPIARQILNDVRLGFQNAERGMRESLDLFAPAVLVAGCFDDWWSSIKHVIHTMRHLPEPALGPDLKPRDGTDTDLRSIPMAFQIAVYYVMTEEEQQELRRQMALGLLGCLKPRRKGQKERTDSSSSEVTQAGYAPDLQEPNPIWREAYLHAIKDLGVKQKGPGQTLHAALEKVARHDPSPDVRDAAKNTDHELNGLRKAWASGSHKRLLSHAWWWIKQAHLLSLQQEIHEEAALRTRVTEFR